MTPQRAGFLLGLAGVIAVVSGIALIYPPAAVIAAGLAALGIGSAVIRGAKT